jgi:predicted RNA binding protein YcfA (HicA-like mRNA interferase family)
MRWTTRNYGLSQLGRLSEPWKADGFELRRQKGSHRRYQHTDGRKVTVSFHHRSDTFPLPTLKSMVEVQARCSEDDLRRLGFLR